MADGIGRDQTKGLEAQVNTRQDRNISLTDGGTLSWNSGTGTLSWSGTLRLRVPGFPVITIAAGSIATVNAAHKAIFVLLDRAAGTVGAVQAVDLGNSGFLSDGAIVLAIRGLDGKLYFRNGSVFASGESKAFGQLNSATDRNDVTADGNALQAVGFSYVLGTDQLAVYVGGLLQQKGLHYTETDVTHVTFAADYIPSAGELINFVNIIGGQGPPGDTSLQAGYDISGLVDVVPGTPLQVKATAGVGGTIVLQIGDAGDVGGLAALTLTRNGEIIANRVTLRDHVAGTKSVVLEVDVDGNLRMHNSQAGSEFGIQVDADGRGIEYGKFASINSPGVTGGPARISKFSGTTSSVGATSIATGLTTIAGVIVSVFNAALGRYQEYGYADGATASREYYVTWNSTGTVTISGASDGTGVVPAALQNQNVQLVVFH